MKIWFEKVCQGLTRRTLWVVGNEHKTFAVSLPGDKKPHWEQNKDKYIVITQLQTRVYIQINKHVFVSLSATNYKRLGASQRNAIKRSVGSIFYSGIEFIFAIAIAIVFVFARRSNGGT